VNQEAVPIATLVVALAWIPVLLRFFRSWRARGNPISLAICVMITRAIYVPVYLTTTLPLSWPIATMVAIDVITCATFYTTIHYASKKFPDTRSGTAATAKN
jgi:hypothetical protein